LTIFLALPCVMVLIMMVATFFLLFSGSRWVSRSECSWECSCQGSHRESRVVLGISSKWGVSRWEELSLWRRKPLCLVLLVHTWRMSQKRSTLLVMNIWRCRWFWFSVWGNVGVI
jgi:hypothetical protein